GTSLTKRVGDGWATTPIDRAAHALRAADVPIGIVTDGRWWVLLWAPRPMDGAAATPGYALWSTDLLLDDELLRSAFTTLLSQHRSLAVAEAKTLRGLFEKSGESQEDITENLSIQTRKAVELLVDAFSAANNRTGGAYLDGVDADHVYQGAVTIMMRLIFTLAAEERRLLPGDDDFYSKTYGIAGLADRIIDRGNLDGEDLLADTYTAFPQILATTRVIHDGIHHNRLNIPGCGGSVFAPHRFPWLETATGNPALGPIGVDDRTMLHILRGLTRWDGRRLSYRTLDVEQIGYAYEGLLDPTAGEARIVGHKSGSRQARQALSWLSDTPTFYDDLSLWEHLEFVARVHGVDEWQPRAEQLLTTLHLSDRRDDIPTTFSRGLRQKAAITLAMIRPFKVMLVDEPFVGLDQPGKEALLTLLDAAAAGGATLVVATHELAFVNRVQRLLALRDGALVYDGSPSEIDVHALVLPS
ncbi:MAG: ATP-binding cassette domain-containing protein, partial [Actinomycetota bacterium]